MSGRAGTARVARGARVGQVRLRWIGHQLGPPARSYEPAANASRAPDNSPQSTPCSTRPRLSAHSSPPTAAPQGTDYHATSPAPVRAVLRARATMQRTAGHAASGSQVSKEYAPRLRPGHLERTSVVLLPCRGTGSGQGTGADRPGRCVLRN